jgi:RNA polymerase sigma-70 factor, ECF subfamily
MVPEDRIPALPGQEPADVPFIDGRPHLPSFVHGHLGRQLQAAYATVLAEPQPPAFLDLLARLDVALSGQEAAASQFRDDLLAALPALRGFAMSLTTSLPQADDLVQETLLRALQNQHRFTLGTNLKAWLFTILRNQFYTHGRRRRREIEDVDGSAAAQMLAPPDQEDGIELREVWARLSKLPAAQREALLLIATHGLTYEAAAALMGCQAGTVKSRVSRARAYLNEHLEGRSAPALT